MSGRVLATEIVFPSFNPERKVFAEAGIEMIATGAGSTGEILDAAEKTDVDAILTATHISISEEVFEQIEGLQVVSSYGIGVDHIDLDSATKYGVPVTNVPDYSIEEVSSHAISLLLNCARSVSQYDKQVGDGGWDWETQRPLRRLRGQTLGVVAFGKIPRRLVEKLDGFSFDVVSYDPDVSESKMAEYGVEKVCFDELLSRSDLITSHVPLNEESYHMFDIDAFKTMKDDAIFVNTSRGQVIDESALYKALEEDEIACAGVDVMENEPPDGSPLVDQQNIIITPHAAWYSEQSMEELQRKAAEEIVKVLQGEAPRYLVNTELTKDTTVDV
ncbi:C-terminal binding protein [Saliphagus sp. LR7]|uniref:C-terminal binding protein n=1 Tax=Saliphagus sp. LR7 TaxID=2282654 RepID=UPI000DF81A04|nr:C-terminal binding protein [Saliphagus sp. LR7]